MRSRGSRKDLRYRFGGRWIVAWLAAAALSMPMLGQSGGQLQGEIRDPATGQRWQLERDLSHPGGPARLVLMAKPAAGPDANTEKTPGTNAGTTPKALRPHPAMTLARLSGADRPHGERASVEPPRLVIRAGDQLIVEEHTAVVDARLEATALSSAAAGSALNIRLQIGGKVMRAVAEGPGRARLETGGEERR